MMTINATGVTLTTLFVHVAFPGLSTTARMPTIKWPLLTIWPRLFEYCLLSVRKQLHLIVTYLYLNRYPDGGSRSLIKKSYN